MYAGIGGGGCIYQILGSGIGRVAQAVLDYPQLPEDNGLTGIARLGHEPVTLPSLIVNDGKGNLVHEQHHQGDLRVHL